MAQGGLLLLCLLGWGLAITTSHRIIGSYQGQGWPKQGPGWLSHGLGWPEQGHGWPKQGHGWPKQSHGLPKQGHGLPKQGHGWPKKGHRTWQARVNVEEEGNKKVEQTKVIIIGAGAAGIAAAERLERGGEGEFLILEATGRVGGRVYSDFVGKGEKKVEFGARYIHGEEGNVVHQMAEEWDMLETEEDEEQPPAVLNEKGERMDPELVYKLEEVFYNINSRLDSLNPDELRNYSSKGDFFTAALLQELQESELQEVESEALQYLQFYGRLQAMSDGAPSWFDVAVDVDQVYQETPGNQLTILRTDTDYQTLIERLGAQVMDRVVHNESVIRVRQLSNDMVEVETDTTVYQCEYAVLTVSLGVLKNKLIEIIPDLPTAKTKAIESIGFGVVTKVFLEYEEDLQTLDPELPLFFLRTQEGEMEGTPWKNLPSTPWQEGMFFSLPYQYRVNPRLVWIWLTGPAALKVESFPNSYLLSSISTFLSTYLTPSHPLAHPISATVTKWGTENTTLGAYSYLDPTTARGAHASLASPVGKVLWAGEATHSTHFATVHGAVESGWREAERILGWKN